MCSSAFFFLYKGKRAKQRITYFTRSKAFVIRSPWLFPMASLVLPGVWPCKARLPRDPQPTKGNAGRGNLSIGEFRCHLLHLWLHIYIYIYFLSIIVLRECKQGWDKERGTARGGDRGLEVGSALTAVSLTWGLNSQAMRHDPSWSGHSTYWATQAPTSLTLNPTFVSLWHPAPIVLNDLIQKQQRQLAQIQVKVFIARIHWVLVIALLFFPSSFFLSVQLFYL